jgi:HTH-type transcriptional regulator / antitoxin HigA
MMTDKMLYSDLAIAPGAYIAEVLEDYGMSQAELARRMGRPAQAINEIVQGTKSITSETALQLERTLRVPASIWLNLEVQYQLTKARQLENEASMQEVGLLDQFPYSDMVKLGWVARVRVASEKVLELKRYLGVSSLAGLSQSNTYGLAFRKKGKASPYALAAWLRHAELEAIKISTDAFDLAKLKMSLPEIRALSRLSPDEFVPRLQALLASCGVALVIQPHLPKTYAHGAVFWMADKAVLIVTIRGRWADVFWFTLFHELGHLVLHGKKAILESDESVDATFLELEAEANNFARDSLISPRDFVMIQRVRVYSSVEVQTFAASINVHSGIVVGRLQHENLLPKTHLNGLRQQYTWQVEAEAA